MDLLEVRAEGRYKLFLRYQDGTCGIVDLSNYAGKGVFAAWLEPGIFEQVRLAEVGHPEWPGNLDLCPDALYLQLTGQQPEEIYPKLNHFPAHA